MSAAVVFVTACSGGGSGSAPDSSSDSPPAASAPPQTITTQPPRAVPGDGEHVGAGVVLAIDRFRVVPVGEDERCAHETQTASAPASDSCLAIDYTLRVPGELTGQGVGRFTSYIDPSGRSYDSSDVASAFAGSEVQTTWYFPAAPGGTLHGEVGVKDGETEEFQVQVPSF